MITAVVDTNVIVRGFIGSHPESASRKLIDALFAGDFLLLLSPDALNEIQHVLLVDTIQEKHGQSDDAVRDFCRALELMSSLIEPTVDVPASITRDVTDTKWVALALAGDADYLVTYDQRHLGRLERVGETEIVRPAPFLVAAVRGRKLGD